MLTFRKLMPEFAKRCFASLGGVPPKPNLKYQLKREPREFKFSLIVDRDGYKKKVGHIEFEEVEDNVYKLTNTKVPDEMLDFGFTNILAKETFDYIAKKDGRILLGCSKLREFYLEKENSKKYAKIVQDIEEENAEKKE